MMEDLKKNVKDIGNREQVRAYLEKIVAFNRKFAGYYDPTVPAYDALLNEYEEGLTMETLDGFFAQLRSGQCPENVTVRGDCYSYSCSISETQTLWVELTCSDGIWTVLRWQSVASTK